MPGHHFLALARPYQVLAILDHLLVLTTVKQKPTLANHNRPIGALILTDVRHFELLPDVGE